MAVHELAARLKLIAGVDQSSLKTLADKHTHQALLNYKEAVEDLKTPFDTTIAAGRVAHADMEKFIMNMFQALPPVPPGQKTWNPPITKSRNSIYGSRSTLNSGKSKAQSRSGSAPGPRRALSGEEIDVARRSFNTMVPKAANTVQADIEYSRSLNGASQHTSSVLTDYGSVSSAPRMPMRGKGRSKYHDRIYFAPTPEAVEEERLAPSIPPSSLAARTARRMEPITGYDGPDWKQTVVAAPVGSVLYDLPPPPSESSAGVVGAGVRLRYQLQQMARSTAGPAPMDRLEWEATKPRDWSTIVAEEL